MSNKIRMDLSAILINVLALRSFMMIEHKYAKIINHNNIISNKECSY